MMETTIKYIPTQGIHKHTHTRKNNCLCIDQRPFKRHQPQKKLLAPRLLQIKAPGSRGLNAAWSSTARTSPVPSWASASAWVNCRMSTADRLLQQGAKGASWVATLCGSGFTTTPAWGATHAHRPEVAENPLQVALLPGQVRGHQIAGRQGPDQGPRVSRLHCSALRRRWGREITKQTCLPGGRKQVARLGPTTGTLTRNLCEGRRAIPQPHKSHYKKDGHQHSRYRPRDLPYRTI